MEQPNDAETVEAAGGATTDRQPHPPPQNIVMNLSDDGKYIQYNISGNIFEVTAKYKPPIMLIGRGAYGIVCSVMNSETNEKVAIKKIVRACRNQNSAKRTLREIKLLRHLEHENIVGIKDIILPYEGDAFEDVYIAYELMDTDLEKIIKSNQILNEQQHLCVMYYFLRGLKYIHSANVLHRDLKPNNLLLNANGIIKICDFGLARVASETRPMTANVTATWYRAPELLLGSSAYTSAIDVWSAGCIFLELMTRTPLFPGTDLNHQLRLILELIGSPTEDDMGSLSESAKQRLRKLNHFEHQSFSVKFPNVPGPAIELVEKMLQFDPRKRISAEDALAHPYFNVGINDEPVCTKLFDFDFEEHPHRVEQIRELIYLEALAFNPEPAPVEEEQ